MTLDKKINMLRLTRPQLKQALNKKFRKTITDKILNLFEQQYFQLQNMPLMGYFDMIQANLFQQCSVTKNWVVPRLFKFYFQLISQSIDKSTICEHDLFVFVQELEGTAPNLPSKTGKKQN